MAFRVDAMFYTEEFPDRASQIAPSATNMDRNDLPLRLGIPNKSLGGDFILLSIFFFFGFLRLFGFLLLFSFLLGLLSLLSLLVYFLWLLLRQ